MTESNDSADAATAEYIAFEAFRHGLPLGRFSVIVNPRLVQPFIAQRINAVPVAIAILGIGIACALGGHVVAGGLLVALGIAFKRVVKWQAPNLLLHLASRQARTYYDATTQGVMEVQRR